MHEKKRKKCEKKQQKKCEKSNKKSMKKNNKRVWMNNKKSVKRDMKKDVKNDKKSVKKQYKMGTEGYWYGVDSLEYFVEFHEVNLLKFHPFIVGFPINFHMLETTEIKVLWTLQWEARML